MPESTLPSSILEKLIGSQPSSGPIRLSLSDLPEPARPGIYREFFQRSVHRLDIEPMRDVPFDADVMVQALTDLHLFSGRLHGSRNRRTRELLADGNDDVVLMVNLAGPYLVSQGKQEIVLGDGDATLVSLAELCRFAHRPPGGVIALRMSRERLAPLMTRPEDCFLRPIPHGTHALKLLTDYVNVAWGKHPIASRDLQHLFVTHVYDLAAVALGATGDAADAARGRGVRAARLRAIKEDIAQNLDQADLSVAALAARHRLTARCLQRLFEIEGTTFTEYVLAQRLARAHRTLSDPRRAAEKVATVAYDAGFGDVSYFNRAFRRHYGTAPSEVRLSARALEAASPTT
jgi:AraC-like DNA-binding protein